MQLEKLFAAQKELRDHINYTGEDRFEKLILALLVEIGECANEQRSWKYWSKDQQPRVDESCWNCGGKGKGYFSGIRYTGLLEKCTECEGIGRDKKKNPLLEEYVDGLHFVLELGLEWKFEEHKPFLVHVDSIEKMFLKNYKLAIMLLQSGRGHKNYYYGELLSNYIGLGKALGFTWEQIEQAYFDKNAVNHQRQESGY